MVIAFWFECLDCLTSLSAHFALVIGFSAPLQPRILRFESQSQGLLQTKDINMGIRNRPAFPSTFGLILSFLHVLPINCAISAYHNIKINFMLTF